MTEDPLQECETAFEQCLDSGQDPVTCGEEFIACIEEHATEPEDADSDENGN